MKISIEITLTPLQDNFEEPTKKFIKRIRSSEFKVIENPLSTQIYGDFEKLMPYLNEEISRSFSELNSVVLNMKLVKGDRSQYEPDF